MRIVVKYLYKYVHKGHDWAAIIIEGDVAPCDIKETQQDRERNEIKEYLDCRYVLAVKSC